MVHGELQHAWRESVVEVTGHKSLNCVFWCMRKEILNNLKQSLLCFLRIYLLSDREIAKYSGDPPKQMSPILDLGSQLLKETVQILLHF